MTDSANHTIITDKKVRPGFRYFGIVAPGDDAKGVPPQRDAVTIDRIKQYQGVTDIVSALHHIPQGDVWTLEEIGKRKIEVEFNNKIEVPAAITSGTQAERDQWYVAEYQRLVNEGTPTGLRWDTVESLSFTEAIKSCDVSNADDCAKRDTHITNFKHSLINLATFGIHNVIGNFMPVADWTRTGYKIQPNGSKALEYDHAAFTAFDIHILKRHGSERGYLADKSYTADEIAAGNAYWEKNLANNVQARVDLAKMIVAGLPGCQGIKSTKAFLRPEEEEQWIAENLLPAYREQVGKYAGWNKEKLQANIATFLDEVAPVAKSMGMNLCAHPDDPAFTPFMGTPRSVGTEEDYKFLLDHGCGVNLCTGSLMANPENRKDMQGIILRLAEHGKQKGMSIDQVFPHVHLRPIETQGKNFVEGEHATHVEDLRATIATLSYLGWHGVFRPDHSTTPTYEMEANGGKPIGDRGYHGAGRAEGLNVILGLFAGMEKQFDRTAVAQELKAATLPSDAGSVDRLLKARLDTYINDPAHMRDRAKPSDWAKPDLQAIEQQRSQLALAS